MNSPIGISPKDTNAIKPNIAAITVYMNIKKYLMIECKLIFICVCFFYLQIEYTIYDFVFLITYHLQIQILN